jgi:hypothetical protein
MWNYRSKYRQKNQHKHANEGLHDLIHQGLKCGRRIREPKWHDGELEVALVCSERRFLNVFRVHSHMMISGSEINLRKESSTM